MIDKTIFYPEQAITEEHQLFSIYRTQVDTVIPHGVAVINADEPMASEMARISESEVIFYGIEDIATGNPAWKIFSTIKKLTPNFVQFNKLPAAKLQGVVTRVEM